MCAEVNDFMKGHHELIDAARKLHVKANRPITRYRNAPPQEKYVLGAAALLDFEARYRKKLDSIEV